MAEEHSIRSLIFSLKTPSSELGNELSDLLSRLVHDQIFDREISPILDQFFPKELDLSLSKLELDLGTIPAEGFEEELIERLKKALLDELEKYQQQQIPNAVDRQQTAFIFFLKNGYLPWWLDNRKTDLPSLLAEVLAKDPTRFIRALRRLPHPEQMARRLVTIMDDRNFEHLIQHLEPVEATFILQYLDDLKTLQKEDPITPFQSSFGKALHVWTLHYLLQNHGSRFNRKAFIYASLRQLAQGFGLSFKEVLSWMVSVIHSEEHSFRFEASLPGLIEEIFKEEIKPEQKVEAETTSIQWLRNWLTGSSLSSGDQQVLKNVWEEAFKDETSALFELVNYLGQQERIRSKLVEDLPDESFLQLIQLIEPVEAVFIQQYEVDAFQIWQDQIERKAIRRFILDYLLLDRGSVFNRKTFVRRNLQNLAMQLKTDYFSVLDEMVLISESLEQRLQTKVGLLRILAELQEEISPFVSPSSFDLWRWIEQEPSTEVLPKVKSVLVRKFRAAQKSDPEKLAQLLRRKKDNSHLISTLSHALSNEDLLRLYRSLNILETGFASNWLKIASSKEHALIHEALLPWMASSQENESRVQLFLKVWRSMQVDGQELKRYKKLFSKEEFHEIAAYLDLPAFGEKELEQPDQDMEVWTHFFKYGFFPWWGRPQSNKINKDTFLQLINQNPETGRTFLDRLLAQNSAKERLARFLGEDGVGAMLKTFAPKTYSLLAIWKSGVQRILDEEGWPLGGRPTLNYLVLSIFHKFESSTHPQEWVRSLNEALLVWVQISREEFQDRLLKYIVEADHSGKEIFLRALPEKTGFASLPEKLRKQPHQSLEELLSYGRLRGIPPEEMNGLRGSLWIEAFKKDPKQLVSILRKFLKSHYHLDQLFRLGPLTVLEQLADWILDEIGYTSKEIKSFRDSRKKWEWLLNTGFKKMPITPNKERMQEDNLEDAEIEAEKIFIDNAGLVILAPYLSRYLKKLDCLEENEFRSETEQEKAMQAIQFLVTGIQNSPEQTLVLPKLLCNWPFEKALPLNEETLLTEDDIAIGISLLNAVKENWPQLKNTSIEGLRESFLQRSGSLEKLEEHWQLNVENKSFDILLDTLPWTFSIIKLPWMELPIHVKWREK